MGQKLAVKWKEKTIIEKVIAISGIVISITIIVLATMQLTGIWENTINVFEPLMGVLMIVNGLNIYKFNKLVAFFCFGVAIFIFVIAFLIFFT